MGFGEAAAQLRRRLTVWILLAVAAVFAAVVTWTARAYALRRRLVDEPGERRSHSVATPRGGGIGPVVAFALLIAAAGVSGRLPGADWGLLLGAVLAVAGIGAWDDHRPLGAGIRLAVHVLAGALLAAAFGLWGERPLVAWSVVAGATVLVNVWNFMDGIDGIASTQAAIFAGATAMVANDADWALLSLGLVACLAGFIPFNFPRARIFLGDVGSGALGMAVALLVTATAVQGTQPLEAILLLLPAAAFLVDATLTLGRRALRGERWWTAHAQHAYQHLARRHGHVPVTVGYAIWSLLGLGLAWTMDGRGTGLMLASVVLWYIACAGAWVYLQYGPTGRSAVA